VKKTSDNRFEKNTSPANKAAAKTPTAPSAEVEHTDKADLRWEGNVSDGNLHWFGDIDGMLGYEEGEFPRTIVGHMENIHPDDQDILIESVGIALNSGSDFQEQYRIRCKDGTYRYWEEYGTAVEFENGKAVKWAGSVTDITRQKVKENIANNKERFLTIIEKFKSLKKLKHADAFSSIQTQNKIMKAVFHYIETIAESTEPVLIIGETGVGKELISKAIYDISNVKGKFVAVNVASLDDTMFSDTLFGHKKGAYTGATNDRKGLIEKAFDGTLLLDEIGDLSDISQVKLLRLIEDRTYYPLGSDKPEKSSARIVASTNLDLSRMVSEGKFRADLYYRLCSIQIQVPPLRERLEDIPILVDHFLDISARALKKKRPTAPDELISLLSSYYLPGNVRELRAIIFDAVAKHRSGVLSLRSVKEYIKKKSEHIDLTFSLESSGSFMPDVSGRFPTLKEAEDFLISEALSRSNNNQGIAASMLGITRQALNSRLKRAQKKK